jgi:hypothetical protein
LDFSPLFRLVKIYKIGAGFRIWIGLGSARGQKTKFQFKNLVIP